MIRGVAAAASFLQAPAGAAADAALAAGGSAVDAIVAAFFASAGADPAVLLAPAIALVHGGGAGARAFDGRSLQPGKGAPRPRGFVDDASIPAAARVAVPRATQMIALLHAKGGRLQLRELARSGERAAKECGAGARAKILAAIGRSGVVALRAPKIVEALVAAGGAIAGGALTALDLEEATPVDADAMVDEAGGGEERSTIVTSPWIGGARAKSVAVACDARGMLAAIAYGRAAEDTVEVTELELALSLGAEPVRRGVQRVAPGAAIDLDACIAILARRGFAAAIGAGGGGSDRAACVSALVEMAEGSPGEQAIEGVAGSVAVATDGKSARAISSMRG